MPQPDPDPRYPIGPWEDPGSLGRAERAAAIAAVDAAPAALRAAVAGLDEPQLDTRDRSGGWTVRQVVHHLPDSHMNSYIRFKIGLTEREPTIRTYHEERFAELPDARAGVEPSLELLEALHRRWVLLLRAIDDAGWQRVILHPDLGRMSLDSLLAFYAWHGRHHVAHVTELRRRRGW